MVDPWIDIITQRLGSPVFTSGEEVRFNCWRDDCGDEKDTHHHLYVNPVKGRYYCHRCERGGSLEDLTKTLGLPQPGGNLGRWEQIIKLYLYGSDDAEAAEDTVVEWPEEYVPVFSGSSAEKYLASRGITQAMIEYYQIGLGTGFLKNRVILPDVDENNKLIYWVARSYANREPKYRNADASRDNQIFNLGRMAVNNLKDRVVICEGPISAIIAGYDAVSTYGKHVTGNQIDKLVRYGAKEYVVAGDGDARGAAVSTATRLYTRGLNVKFARFYGTEDPAEIGHIATRARIEEALRWNSYSAMEVMI